MDALGEALADREILAGIFTRICSMYIHEGGAVPEAVLNMSWDYQTPDNPAPAEVAIENNVKALANLHNAEDNVVVKKGEQINLFAQLRDDGITASYCWVFAGSWTAAGN
ncbi:MAG: hypothetical protein G5663_06370 [Serratia symbiotica]|nr:hypothetical protein [Serratia symbiotica]